MKIALDYDGTYTADPELWDQFISSTLQRGHSIWIVTCRRDTEENREEVKVPGCYVIFTGLTPKDWYCREHRGLKFDVWIDDEPRSILEGR